MPIMHTPEAAGAVARYKNAQGEERRVIEREVIGWDDQGRPLVMCGDALHTAADAPFEKCPVFLNVTRGFPSGEELADMLVNRALWDTDSRLNPIMDVVRDHVDRAFSRFDLDRAVRDSVREVVHARLASKQRQSVVPAHRRAPTPEKTTDQ